MSGGPGFEAFIALRYLRARRKQTFLSLISFLSILGFCVGVAALIIALALMTGFQEDVRRAIIGGNAQLTVFSRDPGPVGAHEVPDPEAVAAGARGVAGVVEASPIIFGVGALNSGGGGFEYTQVQGVDPQRTGRVLRFEAVEGREGVARAPDDAFGALGEPTASTRPPILLGRDLARNLGVQAGDVVKLLIARTSLAPWGPMPRFHHFEVAGIFHAGFDDYDQLRSYIAIGAARKVFGGPEGASCVAVRVNDEADVGEVKGRLEAALGPGRLVTDIIEQNPGFFSALQLEKLLLLLAVGLIVAVAGLSMFTTLILMVMEKVRDIGALVALGLTPRRITRIFLLQGMIVGVAGTLAGTVVGILACWVMTRYRLISLDPDVYYLDHLAFLVRPADVAVVVAMALMASLLATLYPSRKAARLDPVEALHYE